MDTEIKSIKKAKITDQIFSTLKNLILSGTWPAGYKVPSENELAAQFGVSRASVRTSLQKLQALGLLEIKVGDGSYVAEFSLSNFLNEIGEIALKESTLKDVAEFRKTIELAALKTVIEKGSDVQITELHAILNAMMDAVKKEDDDEFYRQDFRFHRKICEISGNSLYVTMYDICAKLLFHHYELNHVASHITGVDIEEEDHYVLFKYIEARDYAKAKEQYRGMIDFVFEETEDDE